MADQPVVPDLTVPAAADRPPLRLRPWQEVDVPALATEMSYDSLLGGMWTGPGERPFRRSGARQDSEVPDRAGDEREAARWIASQDHGWRDGDRLCFAVLQPGDAGEWVLAGNVGLKNREGTGRIGTRETAEIGYWTAMACRRRGIAPAAVIAATSWVFDELAVSSLRQIMLVHDVTNPASCRVAQKADYPFRELSPAHPPHWLTDGHIHIRQRRTRPGAGQGAHADQEPPARFSAH